MSFVSQFVSTIKQEHFAHNYAKALESSYLRCLMDRVPVKLEKPRIILPQQKLIPRLVKNARLLATADGLLSSICCSEREREYIFILCDADLVALKIYAFRETLAAIEKKGIMTGTVFIEKSCGTNALSLAREHCAIVAILALPPEVKGMLTIREQEICLLLFQRLSSMDIAKKLNLSISTVRTHRKNIYRKLGVHGLRGLLVNYSTQFRV